MLQGIQASLDYIQVNVAPQIANLQQSISLAQDQIDQIIIGGSAPNALKFGNQLPAYYATAAALADGLAGKVPNTRKVNGKELSVDIALVKSDVGLGNADNTSDADKPISTEQAEAFSKRVRVDAVQEFTASERGQARANIGVGIVSGFRNKVINGGFEIAQRALSQTSSGYGSDDRWDNSHVGTTKTHSVQPFALGQTDVVGEPAWFSRTVVASVAGANNFCNKIQRIEGVRTLAGKRATLTFYAKANAARTVAVQIFQWFGAGGSPSPQVSAKIEKIALTAAWKRFDIVADIPSLAGKTLGTSNTDHLGIIFWFDAGSSFDVYTSALGHQSGTFDISRVSFVEGDASSESDPFSPRHYDEELRLCERYYQKLSINGLTGITYIPNGDTRAFVKLSRKMRVSPGLSVTPSNLVVIASGDSGSSVNVDLGTMALNTAGPDAIRIGNVANPGQLGASSANVASWGTATPHVFTADAEL
ncbi:conserved hypothetical protein [Agrobacterium deltaense Zutra 3/1]|uniref:CBM-cenC domain-containing protein n=1 Tax=Agrobacterium deltaense Zutra 3/1 TaxID=1183427 RepID=A0A1S7QKM0_9HYPH|nr:hypothetical protein [Agrobacterium deltaense]CUX38396.1 conserved hypothetical protein [Agrobacterium deltaense Zutra 3/1]